MSYLHTITDTSGVAIGQHLNNLRALYMRDNYRLTNQSIDAITASCTKLNQLTLWGCIKLKHLVFTASQTTSATTSSNSETMLLPEPSLPAAALQTHQLSSSVTCKLVALNLWGCYNLRDDLAVALGNMRNLRSLIVSECHKLTDQFAVSLCRTWVARE